jgi:predicted  nucleic acid-binding Zn-ribbon protein
VAEQDLQASKDQLQASKDRLQIALNAAHFERWQYDPLRRTGSGDARANEIPDFDIAEDEEVALEELLKQVHPDNVGGAEAAIATALDRAIAQVSYIAKARADHAQSLSSVRQTARNHYQVCGELVSALCFNSE